MFHAVRIRDFFFPGLWETFGNFLVFPFFISVLINRFFFI